MNFLNLIRKRSAKNRPNIIFILLDQFRNDFRHAHPIFKELSKRGTLFSQVITYAPYTSASVRSLMTGMYGGENGVNAYTRYENYDHINCHSLIGYLRDADYYTRAYTYTKMLLPKEELDSLKIVYEDEEKDVLASHLSEIDGCFFQDNPFFLFLHYGEIHHYLINNIVKKIEPFAPEFFGQIGKNRDLYSRLARDAGSYLQKMIERIDTHDPDQETVVMVFADHGGSLGERPGEKCYGVYAYDYTIRVWLYLIGRNYFPAGQEFSNQVRQVDVLPTFLDLLNIKPSKKHKPIIGKSLFSIMRGQEKLHRIAFTETGGCEGPHPSPDSPNVKCIRDGHWKLILNTTTNKSELYNLESDPSESSNLYQKHPDIVKDLWAKMIEFL